MEMNKTSSSPMHNQYQHHQQNHHYQHQQHSHSQQQQQHPSSHQYSISNHRNRRSHSRLASMASSFSSSTSSFFKVDSFNDDPSSSFSDRGDDDLGNDNDPYSTENDDNVSVPEEEEEEEEDDDDNASKSLSFTTRGKCTGGRPSDEYVRQMLVKTFLDDGRLSNVYRVMSFFPTYYEIFQSTMNNITKTSMGPLHRTWRIYLGIMVE
jgi:hypothetical protein